MISKQFLFTTTLSLFAAMLLAPSGIAASKDTLNAADVKFVKEEAAAGTAQVKLAELGAKKTGNADVKAFAEMIVADHAKANEEMATLATTKGVELSAVIDPKHADTFQKLEQQSATDFDKEFLAAMVSDHKKCVSSFEESSKSAADTDVKAFATKMLPTLKAHLAQAEKLSGK